MCESNLESTAVVEAVIFDIDGTLLQSDANDDTLYLAAVRDVLGNVNLRPSWGAYTQFTAAGILAEILNDNAIEATLETSICCPRSLCG